MISALAIYLFITSVCFVLTFWFVGGLLLGTWILGWISSA